MERGYEGEEVPAGRSQPRGGPGHLPGDTGRAAPDVPAVTTGPTPSSGLKPRAILTAAREHQDGWAQLRALGSLADAGVKAAFRDAVDTQVRQQVRAVPLEQLKGFTDARLSLKPLERAGLRNAGDLLAWHPYQLLGIDGVGQVTAIGAIEAAAKVHEKVARDHRFRFAPDTRPPEQTRLLASLDTRERVQRELPGLLEEADTTLLAIGRLAEAAEPTTRRLSFWFAGRERKEQATEALHALVALLDERSTHVLDRRIAKLRSAVDDPPINTLELWRAFEHDPVPIYATLQQLRLVTDDAEPAHGGLPAEIVAAIDRQPLDLEAMQVTLRGYQAFGARYALVQRRTMLGDEMGLGKTITALAAASHLHAQEQRHVMVVCPTSVLYNWSHEIDRRTDLDYHIVHGANRGATLAAWQRLGGIAITTFGTLSALPFPEQASLPLLIVDEAHYVKNPDARRTKAVKNWASRFDRVLYMTGTPMENRLEEFASLVGHLQPRIAGQLQGAQVLDPAGFQRVVAPVYLRRNQVDVLAELPELIDSYDWVGFTPDDHRAYRAAVASGNFMSMRRAAFNNANHGTSAKMQRIQELVDDSAAAGWKVVVFSFFRDVLAAVTHNLDAAVFGPIDGSMTSTARLQLIDEFTDHDGPAVLVSQIEAGGVGLNIQAASTVILCEPQWKPSTEQQAIARCHRMGQLRPVQVHRLVTENAVDEKLMEAVRAKTETFDTYVRQSAVADASPEAKDRSQHQIAANIIAAERERLGIDSHPVSGPPVAPSAASPPPPPPTPPPPPSA